MSKYFLFFSLIANVFFLFAIVYGVQRLGGVQYAWYRLRHSEAGLYEHRKQLFEQMPVAPGAIIFLGDSQTEQCEWREWLQWDSNLAVLNRGITADHTAGIQARLPEVLRHRPSKIYLMVGINDLLFGGSPAETARRYRALVQTIRRESPATILVIQTLPPVNNTLKKMSVSNTEIQSLNTELIALAHEYALPLVDLYVPLCDYAGNLSKKFTEDGLHLNAEGYRVWKQAVKVAKNTK